MCMHVHVHVHVDVHVHFHACPCACDFAPHMKRRHSFRDQIIAKVAILANFQKLFVEAIYIIGVYMTTFEKIKLF